MDSCSRSHNCTTSLNAIAAADLHSLAWLTVHLCLFPLVFLLSTIGNLFRFLHCNPSGPILPVTICAKWSNRQSYCIPSAFLISTLIVYRSFREVPWDNWLLQGTHWYTFFNYMVIYTVSITCIIKPVAILGYFHHLFLLTKYGSGQT